MKGTCVFLWKKIFLQDKINFPWAHGNLVSFKKAKFRLLHLAQCNFQSQHSLGEKGIQNSPAKRDLTGGWKAWIDQQYAPTDQRANHVLGCVKSSAASRSREVILPHYSALMRSHPKCCIQLWGPQNKKEVKLLECIQRKVTNMIGRMENLLKSVRELGLLSLDKRMFWGDFSVTFQYLKCVYKKGGERLFNRPL